MKYGISIKTIIIINIVFSNQKTPGWTHSLTVFIILTLLRFADPFKNHAYNQSDQNRSAAKNYECIHNLLHFLP